MHTPVLIIGGGVTGTGLARDLALRGVLSTLVESGDINSGASGRNHGLLHSGARYVATDPGAARECRDENEILNRVAPHCIEKTGGLFVAVEGDDEKYAADFPHLCSKCGIFAKRLTPEEAMELEPSLSSRVFAAYLVDDASIDPFRLSLENITHAQKMGSTLLCYTRVTGFEKKNNRIRAVHLVHTGTGRETVIEPDQIINATGAWVGQVAALAGIRMEMLYSKGTLLVTGHRIANRVINRLRRPGDGDILVPGGTVSLLGTTSVRVNSLEDLRPTIEEVDLIVDEGSKMIPTLRGIRYIRAYAGVRPLLKMDTELDDRSVSRGFHVAGSQGRRPGELRHRPLRQTDYLPVHGGENRGSCLRKIRCQRTMPYPHRTSPLNAFRHVDGTRLRSEKMGYRKTGWNPFCVNAS